MNDYWKSGGHVTGVILNVDETPLTDVQYETLRRAWLRFQRGGPKMTLIVERPLMFIPFTEPDYPPTPGDELN